MTEPFRKAHMVRSSTEIPADGTRIEVNYRQPGATMTEMVEWLRGVVTGDLERAKAATPGPWEWTAEVDVWGQCGPTLESATAKTEEAHPAQVLAGWGHDACGLTVSEPDQEHIATHDPRDTIARCEAELEIIDEHALMHRDIGYLDENREEVYEELEVCARCVSKHSHYASRADVPTGPCRTVRLMISGYRHREGWKEEWLP